MSDSEVDNGHAPAEGARANRLAQESSPYLLLHRFNPVDWYPWGEEALEKARRENKPIFLSVGYSTCYWCHVMERQSFADPEIAELMNRHFVNIKVDREERPDLDEIYMAATSLLTGHGGWPNSVFLTPELKPFFAGTYFPPRDQRGRPGFVSVLMGLNESWKGRREQVNQQAEEVATAVKRYLEDRNQPGEAPPDPAIAGPAFDGLARRYDAEWGGFGGAPKFPTPSNLLLLEELIGESPEAEPMLETTLDQMARGGIYDQLAGGFHRYATDREWRIPHFEKMLYDNGLLLQLYARAFGRTGNPEWARICRETTDFLIREMTSPDGAFLSAIDAETDGKEGAYYVWTRDELTEALGEEDSVFLASLLGFEGAPSFEGGHYVLHLPETIADQARVRRTTAEELLAQIRPLRDRLLARRDARDRPLTDDKILADWNGMAIAGMALAGEALGDESLVERAGRAARFVLTRMRGDEGLLLHSWRAGQGKIPAYLGDYAFLVQGLLELHRITGEAEWLAASVELTVQQIERLRDPAGGFFVAAEDPDLMARSKDVVDGATPSPNAVAVLNLLALAERTGDASWRQEAHAALSSVAPIAQQLPEAVRMLAVAARRFAASAPETAASTGGATSAAVAAVAAAVTGAASGGAEPGEIPPPEELVAARLTMDAAQDDGWSAFRLNLVIAPTWHVNANPPSDEFMIATAVEADGGELGEVVYPAGQAVKFTFAESELSVYEGEVEITGRFRAGEGESALVLVYQACDDSRCLPPERRKLSLTE